MAGRFDIVNYSDLSPEETWTRLGKGSFGCVYKGELLGIDVAIKEVLDSDDYPVEKYFQREVTFMQEARHPNVVLYIGLCLAPTPVDPAPIEPAPSTSSFIGAPASNKTDKPKRKRILILSEFLGGGNLRTYIADTSLPFPWRHRLSFAIDIARAVAYLHSHDCMHRDLKGENLLITDNQRIKVCDFGFARIAAQNQDEMRRMSYCGTDGYMSPEINQGAEFDVRTDVFSFGVILAEIISRTLADSDVFARYAPDYAMNMDEIRERASPGCPATFIDIAMACCATDPDDRPAILTVLDVLRKIESDVIAEERKTTKKPVLHIGTIKFSAEGGTIFGRGSHKQRPSFGRIPSFKGQVVVPRRSGSSSSVSTIGSEVEIAREGLDHIRLVEEAAKKSGEEKWLEEMPDSPEKKREGAYSTEVVRASKISSACGGSSILTVRPAPPAPIEKDGEKTPIPRVEAVDYLESIAGDTSSDTLPTIPSAWIRDSNGQETAKAAAQLSLDPEVQPVVQPSYVGSIATFLTAQSDTPSIAAATVNAPVDHTPAATKMELPLDGFLHRFSLIKPTWLQIILGITDVGGHVCECCRKKFGRSVAYFKCDDCDFRSHPRCADAAPADCHAGLTIVAPPLANAEAAVSTSSLLSPKVSGGFGKLRRKSRT